MLICFFQQWFIHPGCSSTTRQACAKHHRPPATNKTGEVPIQEREMPRILWTPGGHVMPAHTLCVCVCVSPLYTQTHTLNIYKTPVHTHTIYKTSVHTLYIYPVYTLYIHTSLYTYIIYTYINPYTHTIYIIPVHTNKHTPYIYTHKPCTHTLYIYITPAHTYTPIAT